MRRNFRRVGLTEYLLRQQGSPDLERSRLKLLEELHDPLSVSQLDATGIGEGWRCLDVGAGGGSVTRMLADRVGSTGCVLAIDIDTSLLEPLRSDRIEVRCLDLLSDPLPQAEFDLVHARNVLMHLPSRQGALRRLVEAARPGGWVLAVDPDFTSVALSPYSLTWERVWSAFLDALVAGGWDPRYGARLGADFRAAGLAEVRWERVGRGSVGGSLHPRLLSLSLERLRERMVTLGADDGEIDEARRLLEDSASTVSSATICLASGRRETAP
jgi:SAM-dependent methyltransferase